MKERRYYLVSTNHFCDRIWFHDDEDFKVAMNLVAVVAYATGVNVLDFVLMSNHVHFLLFTGQEDSEKFVSMFKMLYGRYYSKKYSGYRLLRDNAVDIREVKLENDSLERAIAYIQMNPVAANICPHPSQYPWGCGNLFFSSVLDTGTPLSEVSLREQFRMTHSRVALPENYKVLSPGYIDPASYIAVDTVESVFRTPGRYNYFLTNSSKAKSRLEERPTPSFRDQIVLGAMQDLCRTVFRKATVGELTEAELSELFRQLRWRLSAEVAQLARVSGYPYREVARLLDLY